MSPINKTISHCTIIFKKVSVCAVAMSVLASCSSKRELRVPIERVSSNQYKLAWVHAYQGEREVRIWGLVRRIGHPSSRGHIQIEARSVNGDILATTYTRLPSMGVRRRSSSFGAVLKVLEPRDVNAINVAIRYGHTSGFGD